MRKQILGSALAGAMIVTTGLSVSAQRAEPRERPQRAQPTTPPQQRGDQAQQMRNQVCPADIENLQVQAEELQDGGALVFTTDQQNVQMLRQRLTQFVQIHDQQLQQMGSPG
ncbi:MAG: hypothetical protein M3Y87_22780, partial [Myxococcota bacterium]|nr:hypothetical protein [Myxococcota bacterium]